MKEASNPIPAGRLQRAASSQETYISKFRQVLARHGLTMALIAIICLLLPSIQTCLLYTSPSPRDGLLSRMPSSA